MYTSFIICILLTTSDGFFQHFACFIWYTFNWKEKSDCFENCVNVPHALGLSGEMDTTTHTSQLDLSNYLSFQFPNRRSLNMSLMIMTTWGCHLNHSCWCHLHHGTVLSHTDTTFRVHFKWATGTVFSDYFPCYSHMNICLVIERICQQYPNITKFHVHFKCITFSIHLNNIQLSNQY